jgi:signal transduction histidine kinase
MKTKSSLIVLIVILAGLTTFYSCNCDECPTPTNQVSQYTLDKTIVETNTTNMATGFETVFSEMIPDSTDRAIFSQKFVDAARFYNDNSGYFFIETLNDAWVVAIVNHDLIGTSRINVQDINGKYFIREIVETVQYSGHGFVEYYRQNPSTEAIERKLSFVTSIPSAQWFIGTGFYGDPPEKLYDPLEAQKTILMEVTSTAAKGIAGILDSIYTTEEDQITFCQHFIDHIRFFDDGSGYFFINDFDGINIAHGADLSHQGQNDIDLQDTHGAYIIRDMITIAQNNNSGYYQYYWVNPATGTEQTKITFVIRIPNTDYFIGAGFYVK